MIRATGANLRLDRLKLVLGGDLSFAVTSANGGIVFDHMVRDLGAH